MPNNEGHKVNGLLSVDEDGTVDLLTLGTLDDSNSASFVRKYDSAFGLVVDKKSSGQYKVVLHNILQNMGSVDFFNKAGYSVDILLTNKWHNTDNLLDYNHMSLHSKFFHNNFRSNAITINWLDFKNFHFEFKYKRPKHITLYNSRKFHIYILYSSNLGNNALSSINFEEKPFLNIKIKYSSYNIKQFMELRMSVERLFMILWEQPHQFDINSISTKNKTNYELQQKRRVIKSYGKVAMESAGIIQNFSVFWDNWIEVQSEFKDELNYFFFNYSDFHLDVTNKFLNLCFTLEQLHSKSIRARDPLPQKHERMYLKVMSELKEGDSKSWLTKVLNKDRNISLDVRLQGLYDSLEPGFDFQNMRLTKDEMRKIKTTRNYHVHLDKKLEDKALTPIELITINEKLSELFIKVIKSKLR